MISLLSHKETARALKDAVMGIDGIPQNAKGTVIEYHQGDWSDNIGLTAVGKMAMDLHKLGRVRLFQTPLQGEKHSYVAVKR
jgi:hypothetical protein